MKNCMGCPANKDVCEIADGLYVCPKCEEKYEWVLVQHIETKELYWKHFGMALCDENIVDRDVKDYTQLDGEN